MQTGWGKVPRFIKMLNTQQYIEMRKEAFKNDGITPTIDDAPDLVFWDTTRYTNWQKNYWEKQLGLPPLVAGVSGGNQSLQYRLGGTYSKETMVFPGNFSDRKGSLHVSLNTTSSNQKFNIQFTGSYLSDHNRLPGRDFSSEVIFLAPNAPALYNEDGTINLMPDASGKSTFGNPLLWLKTLYQNKTTNAIGNVVLRYQITPELAIGSSFGYNNIQGRGLSCTR